jgi:hypothetical protein
VTGFHEHDEELTGERLRDHLSMDHGAPIGQSTEVQWRGAHEAAHTALNDVSEDPDATRDAINGMINRAVQARIEQREQEPKTTIEVTEAERELLLTIRVACDAPELLWNTSQGLTDLDEVEKIQGRAYSAAAEALVAAGKAAFDYVADEQGVSGFQGSWAALKLYGDLMNITCPYGIYKLEDALYPQYDLRARLDGWLTEPDNIQWLADQAREHLAHSEQMAPAVRAHMEHLAQRTAHPW